MVKHLCFKVWSLKSWTIFSHMFLKCRLTVLVAGMEQAFVSSAYKHLEKGLNTSTNASIK